jgi:hypothetical protein
MLTIFSNVDCYVGVPNKKNYVFIRIKIITKEGKSEGQVFGINLLISCLFLL